MIVSLGGFTAIFIDYYVIQRVRYVLPAFVILFREEQNNE